MRIISGSARGRKILSPQSSVTRPTLDRIKESIFNIIQNQVYGSGVWMFCRNRQFGIGGS